MGEIDTQEAQFGLRRQVRRLKTRVKELETDVQRLEEAGQALVEQRDECVRISGERIEARDAEILRLKADLAAAEKMVKANQ